jgi:hypothetical protein
MLRFSLEELPSMEVFQILKDFACSAFAAFALGETHYFVVLTLFRRPYPRHENHRIHGEKGKFALECVQTIVLLSDVQNLLSATNSPI